MTLFTTVLVANRGEIACRVIRTLRRLGIRSVAVYSEYDAGARHVLEADLAVPLAAVSERHGNAPGRADGYLDPEAIIAACTLSGAEAVHPGYGFLSENAGFAQALQAAGIRFIGPGHRALHVMGDKIRAKSHVSAHGVPVVPGVTEPDLSDAELVDAAEAVGYPLLVKPSAGGGGKGMQAVTAPGDLPAALAAARRVAVASFGDGTLFLERLIPAPRHIEVQVLADSHGNVIHLGERECSLQRRHQKVIEEAPSVLLDEHTRAAMGRAACSAAASVDYTGAGTVEFLVSAEAPDTFYFMEMNTRLQVEHPVTEMVTGVDLVEWQVRIAAGEQLTMGQNDVVLNGHAVEARVYAEDPAQDFLPAGGRVELLDEPAGEGIRVDSSLLPGQELATRYDPMLAKIIAWAPDRPAALARLDGALSRTVILGTRTNIEYLRLLLADPDVAAGRLDTTLIERKLPGMEFRQPGEEELAAAALAVAARRGSGGEEPPAAGPWERLDGWRLGEHSARTITLTEQHPGGAVTHTVALRDYAAPSPLPGSGGHPGEAAAVVVVDSGTPFPAAVRPLPDHRLLVTALGRTRMIALTHSLAGGSQSVLLGDGGWSCELNVPGRRELLEADLSRRAAAAAGGEAATADPDVRSPMPGTVVSVFVANGDQVTAGQPLLSIEAMKMEHRLDAPAGGEAKISLQPGDLVKAGQIVARVHPGTKKGKATHEL